MINWQKFVGIEVRKNLRLGYGAVIETVSVDGVVSTISIAEQAVLDGVTAGTVTASKAVVVDANKDISAFRDVTVRKLIGSTAPLNIDGLAAAQGGAITITGGTSSTTGNAGGAVNIVGGIPGATGIGGAVNITGGTPVDAAGGAIVLTGGAGVGTNRAGGAITLVTGAGIGSAASGVLTLSTGAAGATGASGAISITSGTAAGGASGAVTITSGNPTGGAVGTVTLTSGAAQTAATAGGIVAVTGGTGNTSGAGGAVNITGGVPGSSGVGGAVVIAGAAGGSASGAGGAVTLTGGAGTAGNGNGGSVTLTPGAKHGTGLDGNIVLRSGAIWYKQSAATTDNADTPYTLTAAEMLGGISSMTPTTGRAVTTLTGAQIEAAVSILGLSADDAFEFSVQNRAAFAATDDILTLTAGASGVTVTGSAVISPGSTARFRCRRTAVETYIIHKIAG